FTPRQKQYSPVLSGIGESELRPLKGYVCTTAKALADVPLISDKDDPVLAHWQYGVGKAVAFTSEAQARWAPDWIEWNKFAKFWAQTVRWTLRGELSQNLQLHTEIEEGIGHVVVDAMDNQGNFINFLELEGSVVDPHLAAQPLALRQTGPGRYEATFPVAGEGSYLVTARSAGKEGITGFITGGLAIPYSPEYKTVRSNEAVMRKIAEVTGGRVASLVNNQVDFFDHDLPSGSRAEPLWPGALALAILLVPVDVFFRRVIIDWRDVARVWNTARGWVAGQVRAILARRRPEREEAVEALLQVKEKVREQMTPRAPSEQFIEALHRAKQQAGASVLDAGEEKAPVPRPVVVRKSEKEDLRRPRVPAERFTSQLLEAKKRAHQEGKGHTQQ
ncbi:hypothetical protein FJY63_10395, partial [Candidatus Sumerlaeota bacterium]|nr:hypothetical protein [Candidatus Sumerlaeota bacterium]